MKVTMNVITVISNPRRYQSRIKLYHNFAKHMFDSGVKLLTVEYAFGDRPYTVTEKKNKWHLQVRGDQELWIKENLINLGVRKLCQLVPNWEYVAWLDADIAFARQDWVAESIHMLQHHRIIQLFSEAHDLGPQYQPLQRHRSFAWTYYANGQRQPSNPDPDFTDSPYGPYGMEPKQSVTLGFVPWHPGFAWAIRRDAFDSVGGLLEVAISGAADNHMAKAVVGDAAHSFHPDVSRGYSNAILDWQNKAISLRKDIGYVDGLILHHWHGSKIKRKYWDRWQILVKTQYDPYHDIKKDSQGCLRLHDDGSDRFILLRNMLRSYFQGRDEDSSIMDIDYHFPFKGD